MLVLSSEHEGRGIFVELGAALARAHRGELHHVVMVGSVQQESVFHHHPTVSHVSSVDEWLRDVAEA